ncbi:hypothetical protein HHK36_019566 [Tetracentron sinense]|uniref:DUF4283 domain-containing protein n=1 Tax=Tetracentron sinense TaxID=13715 RepID=A0A834Z1J3_TETSI|nr:hypothetical protein HHK36_019566 [Tetracentron sinense]
MAPSNEPTSSVLSDIKPKSSGKYFELSDGKLSFKGVTLLSEVPNNVSFSSFPSICCSSGAPFPLYHRVMSLWYKGGFLGFSNEERSNRLENSLGKFSGRDFLSIFRFKTWWSTMWVGTSGSDLQKETQWVLLGVPELESYVLILPLIEGKFRSALHPGVDGHVKLCAESGSIHVKASSLNAIAYVHISDNPYNLMKEAYSALRVHLNTFRLLEEKSVPPLVDKFGWCTRDAFYLTVDPIGVRHGVQEFVKGEVPPRFLIIDDAWLQCISFDGENPLEDAKNLVLGGTQMTGKRYRFEESEKFKMYQGGTMFGTKLGLDAPSSPKRPKMMISSEYNGMEAFIRDLRTNFKGLDDIYVWQAFCGACGGVRPDATHLNSKVIPVKVSAGLVHPDQAINFYESLHSYLAKVGIAGVKVDVIHTLEYVSEEYGGRVELAKAYYKGLTESLVDNFKGTELISSMQQCNDDFFLGTWQIALGRVGDDFCFQDPNGDMVGVYWLPGVHMIHCAYNSMWMGQIIQPDWDMFRSSNILCAKFHAGSRAICGGPVYVSDSVGSHDFDLIKKLVFPDGTIPKCLHFALPTRDCLFKNPLFDSKTILKIWNLNKFGGVIGAFNCQGAGWDPKEQRIKDYSQCYMPISGLVHISDVEWDQKIASAAMGEADEYVVYLNQAEELLLMTPKSDPFKMTIQPSTFEIFSFVPIKKLSPSTKFAPIGLTNMFNSGGTIQGLEYSESGAEIHVKIKIKGEGKFLAYSSRSPKKCYLDGAEMGFEWVARGFMENPKVAASVKGGSSKPPDPPPTYAAVLGKQSSIASPSPSIPIKKPGSYRGEPVIFFSEEESSIVAEPLQLALVAKCSYGRPSLDDIKTHMKKTEGLRLAFTMGILDTRHLLFQFASKEDFLMVWIKEVISINGYLFRFFKCTPSFLSGMEPSIVLVWVSFSNHPTLDDSALTSIGSILGKVLKLDGATKSISRPSVARVCI